MLKHQSFLRVDCGDYDLSKWLAVFFNNITLPIERDFYFKSDWKRERKRKSRTIDAWYLMSAH